MVPCLPPFSASNTPNFTWRSNPISRSVFLWKDQSDLWVHCSLETQSLFGSYGNAGSHFITELAKLCESFGSASAVECIHIALKAAMVLLALLLQKPHMGSKSHENIKCLERCLHLWHEGDIDVLLVKGHAIQQHLHHSHCTPLADSSHRCACLVFHGKIKAAMWFLTEQSWDLFLLLSTPVGESTVFDGIIRKHTPMSFINPDTTTLQSFHPFIFDRWTMILFVILLFR